MSAVLEPPRGFVPVVAETMASVQERHLECPICFELYDEKMYQPLPALGCRHSMCCMCLDKMLGIQKYTSFDHSHEPSKIKCPICRMGTFHRTQEPNELVITLIHRINSMKAARSRLQARAVRIRLLKAYAVSRFDEAELYKDQLRHVTEENKRLVLTITELKDKHQADEALAKKSLMATKAALEAVEKRIGKAHAELEQSKAMNLEILATNDILKAALDDGDCLIRLLEKNLLRHLKEAHDDRDGALRTQRMLVMVQTTVNLVFVMVVVEIVNAWIAVPSNISTDL